MARFSKYTLKETLQKRLDAIQDKYDFDPDNGTAQLSGDTDEAVAYGEREAMLNLADIFEIDLWPDPRWRR